MNKLTYFSEYHPAWEGGVFTKEEFNEMLEGLAAKHQNESFIVENHRVKKTLPLGKIWQVFKGWMGFANETDPIKVNYQLLKMLRYGEVHQFLQDQTIINTLEKLIHSLQSDPNHHEISLILSNAIQSKHPEIHVLETEREIKSYFNRYPAQLQDAFWARLYHEFIAWSYPASASQYANRARVFADEGQFSKALASIDQSLKITPEDPKWLLAKAEILFKKAESLLISSSNEALEDYGKTLTALQKIPDGAFIVEKDNMRHRSLLASTAILLQEGLEENAMSHFIRLQDESTHMLPYDELESLVLDSQLFNEPTLPLGEFYLSLAEKTGSKHLFYPLDKGFSLLASTSLKDASPEVHSKAVEAGMKLALSAHQNEKALDYLMKSFEIGIQAQMDPATRLNTVLVEKLIKLSLNVVKNAINEDDLNGAQSLLEQMNALSPNNIKILKCLVKISVAQGEGKLALKWNKLLTELDPASVIPVLQAATAPSKPHDKKSAASSAKKGIGKSSDDLQPVVAHKMISGAIDADQEIPISLGDIAFSNGKLQEAADHYLKAAAAVKHGEPEFKTFISEKLIALGERMLDEGDNESCLIILDEAYRFLRKTRSPQKARLAELYKALGHIEESSNHIEPSIRNYEKALHLVSQDDEMLLALGNLYPLINRHDEAINAFTRLKEDASEAGLYFRMRADAEIALIHGKYQEALEIFKRLLTASPEDRALQKKIAICLSYAAFNEKGQSPALAFKHNVEAFQKADETLKKIIFNNLVSLGVSESLTAPEFGYKCLSQCLNWTDHVNKASMIPLASDEQLYDIHKWLAICASKLRDFADAKEHFEIALAINEHDSVLINEFGTTLMELNLKDEAAALFEKACNDDPSNPIFKRKLSDTLEQIADDKSREIEDVPEQHITTAKLEDTLYHIRKAYENSPSNAAMLSSLLQAEHSLADEYFSKGMHDPESVRYEIIKLGKMASEGPHSDSIVKALGRFFPWWSPDNASIRNLGLYSNSPMEMLSEAEKGCLLIEKAYDGENHHMTPDEMPEEMREQIKHVWKTVKNMQLYYAKIAEAAKALVSAVKHSKYAFRFDEILLVSPIEFHNDLSNADHLIEHAATLGQSVGAILQTMPEKENDELRVKAARLNECLAPDVWFRHAIGHYRSLCEFSPEEINNWDRFIKNWNNLIACYESIEDPLKAWDCYRRFSSGPLYQYAKYLKFTPELYEDAAKQIDESASGAPFIKFNLLSHAANGFSAVNNWHKAIENYTGAYAFQTAHPELKTQQQNLEASAFTRLYDAVQHVDRDLSMHYPKFNSDKIIAYRKLLQTAHAHIGVPEHISEMHLDIGMFDLSMGHRADARKHMEEAAKLSPHHPKVNLFLSKLDIAEHRYSEAIARLTREITEGRHTSEVAAELSDAENHLGNIRYASALYAKALDYLAGLQNAVSNSHAKHIIQGYLKGSLWGLVGNRWNELMGLGKNCEDADAIFNQCKEAIEILKEVDKTMKDNRQGGLETATLSLLAELIRLLDKIPGVVNTLPKGAITLDIIKQGSGKNFSEAVNLFQLARAYNPQAPVPFLNHSKMQL